MLWTSHTMQQNHQKEVYNLSSSWYFVPKCLFHIDEVVHIPGTLRQAREEDIRPGSSLAKEMMIVFLPGNNKALEHHSFSSPLTQLSESRDVKKES